jgi:hypothetical protein
VRVWRLNKIHSSTKPLKFKFTHLHHASTLLCMCVGVQVHVLSFLGLLSLARCATDRAFLSSSTNGNSGRDGGNGGSNGGNHGSGAATPAAGATDGAGGQAARQAARQAPQAPLLPLGHTARDGTGGGASGSSSSSSSSSQPRPVMHLSRLRFHCGPGDLVLFRCASSVAAAQVSRRQLLLGAGVCSCACSNMHCCT